jgi:YD repeat-containing protein
MTVQDRNQTTWVPLIDASGSTIALVNAGNMDAGPVTTYTYDPAGNPTVSGTANDWPFLYQGMEKESTDPGPYYYSGGGQFYSP